MADSGLPSHKQDQAGSKDQLLISPLRESLAPECVELLFQAFLTNPLNTALLGSGGPGLRRKRRATQLAWKALTGETFVATIDGTVVGVLHFVRHPQRWSSRWRVLRLLPQLLWVTGPVVLRALRWRLAWHGVHPREAHSHLGPVAVLPEFQGKGIGSEMVKNYCSMLDQNGETSYLETDKHENVRLYSRFGFEVTKEFSVLGVPNWIMRRRPRRVE